MQGFARLLPSKTLFTTALVMAVVSIAQPADAAKTIVVTNTGDGLIANRPAPPRSLREAVEQLAEPGDTIVFDVSGPVTLARLLRIPPRLVGLTIQGPATINGGRIGHIEIAADHVTLSGLHLETIDISGGKGLFIPTPGLRIVNNTFAGNSSVLMESVQTCDVTDNQFKTTGEGSVISFYRTTQCRIADNVISSPAAWQIEDYLSVDLTIERNTLSGGIDSRQRSGAILRNTLHGTQRLEVAYNEPVRSGRLRIANNRAPGIVVQRTNVEIVGNILNESADLKAPAGMLLVNNQDSLGPSGDVLVERNEINGGKYGVLYSEGAGAGAGTLRHNVIAGCRDYGMRVNRSRATVIERNDITDCGKGTTGIGLAITNSHDIVADTNTVLRTAGTGILVVDAKGPVTLLRNTVRDSRAAGLAVRGGPGRVFGELSTITGSGGPGVQVEPDARASIVGGTITANGAAGVLVETGALVAVSRASLSRNTGPGIDIVPQAVTPNPSTKLANLDIDWPEDLMWFVDRLEGRAAPGSLVEIFAVESGARTGNPENGEGETSIGSALADAAGRFIFALPCTPGLRLTTTATLPADQPPLADNSRTSEFSRDVTCSLAPVVTITSIDVRSIPDLVVGSDRSSAQLTTIATDSTGASRDLTSDPRVVYTSSDPTIADVSNAAGTKGQITAKKAGEVTITAEIPASDSQPRVVSAPIVIRVVDPLRITAGLPHGVIGQPYAAGVGVSGGIGPHTFTLTWAPLPAGLTLNASTGEITGTPEGESSDIFRIEVRDASNPPQETVELFYILVLHLEPQTLPAGQVGTPYPDTVLTAAGVFSGDDAPGARFTVVDGGLPPGLTLDEAGVLVDDDRTTSRLSGTPLEAGTFPFTVQVEDLRDGRRETETYSITIAAAPPRIVELRLSQPPDLVVGTVRDTSQVTALAVDAAGNATDVTADARTFFESSSPGVVTVSNDPATKGQLRALTSGEASIAALFREAPVDRVHTARPVIARSIAELFLPNGVLAPGVHGQPYSGTVGLPVNGIGPFTFASNSLPPGLSIDAATSAITGVTETSGTLAVRIDVSDSANPPQSAFGIFQLAMLRLLPGDLPKGRVGVTYSDRGLFAEGVGDATRTASHVTAGSLPPGLILDATSGGISGTPTESGTFGFTVEIVLSDGRRDSEVYSIVVEPEEPPLIAVPVVTGLIRSSAVASLTGAGLSIGTVTREISETALAGFIIGQSPEPGTEVPEGSAVDLTEAVQQFTLENVGTVIGSDAPWILGLNGVWSSAGGTMTAPGGVVACPPPENPSAPPCAIRVEQAGTGVINATGHAETTISGETRSCADTRPCTTFTDRALLDGTPRQWAELVIEKLTEGGDGTFQVVDLLRLPPSGDQFGTIQTVDGKGTSTVIYRGLAVPIEGSILGEAIFNVTERSTGRGFAFERFECERARVSTTGDGFFVTVTAGETAVCTFTNSKLPVGENRPTATTGNEGINATNTFGLPTGNRIVIAGANGLEIRDAITDQTPTAGTRLLSFVDTGSPYQNLYGALVVPHPSGNGSDALFTHGAGGYSSRQFFPATGDFGGTQVSFPAGQNITDAVYFGGTPAAAGVLWTKFTRNKVRAHVWQDLGGLFFNEAPSDLVTDFNVDFNAGMVSAFTYDLRFAPNGTLRADSPGWIATVLDGTPGQLWISNPQTPFVVGTLVGLVGDSPRRIRCLPSTQLCAVSNFASDSVTIVNWDGRATAAITGTAPVGDGPVGIDLRPDGVNTLIISTGFNDHTFTVTTIDANGSVLSSVTMPVPTGCVNPGHAVWLPNQPGTAAITCKGSNSYAIVTP